MVSKDLEKKYFINSLRGMAIFLMLWGHCIQYCCGNQFDFFENIAFKTIYTFHMPLFMMISGYFLFFSQKKRTLQNIIFHRTTSLLYPILMCSVLNRILTSGIDSIVHGMYLEIFGGIPLTSLWFLWSVLAASFILSFAAKSNNRTISALLTVFGIGLVALFPCWEDNVFMYPYFVAGFLFAKHDISKKQYNILGIISIIIYVILLFFYEKKHYIYTSGLLGGGTLFQCFKIDIFRWAIGLFGSIAFIYLCKILNIIKHRVRIVRGIEFLGSNSLAIYALSVSLLSFWLPRIANKLLILLPYIDWNKNITLYNFFITPAIAIAYSVLLALIVKLLKKLDVCKYLFGR